MVGRFFLRVTPIPKVGGFEVGLLCEGASSLALNKPGCGDNGGFRLAAVISFTKETAAVMVNAIPLRPPLSLSI